MACGGDIERHERRARDEMIARSQVPIPDADVGALMVALGIRFDRPWSRDGVPVFVGG